MTLLEFIGKAKYDPSNSKSIYGEVEKTFYGRPLYTARHQLLLLRGKPQMLGYLSEDEANLLQDELGKFIADAINEKIEREKL